MEELDILAFNEEDDTLADVLTKKKYESASEVLENYERLKKISKSSLVLNKYDRAKIIGTRAQQIACKASPLVKVPPYMTSVIDIAELELKERKTPFILRKRVGDEFEYFKIEDLVF